MIIALAALAVFAGFQANRATQQRDIAVTAEARAVSESNTRATEVVVRTTAQANADRSAKAEATAAADAKQKQAEAEREARRARAGELSAVALGQLDRDPELALLVAQEAISVTRTFESEEALRRALRGSLLRAAYAPDDLWIGSATFAPDGTRLLVTGNRGEQPVAQILEVPSLKPVVELHDPPGNYITDARFSPNGERILTVDDSDSVSLWDARTGTADPPFQGVAADWSADGSRFVVAADDGTLDIRNAIDGRGELTFARA